MTSGMNSERHNLILGLDYRKNGLSDKHPIDFTGKRELVLVDLDYLLNHAGDVLALAHAMAARREAEPTCAR